MKDATAILDVFQKYGHNEIDSARGYGGGTSEEYLGELHWQDRGIIWVNGYDDGNGGDTNADGNTTVPVPQGWGGISGSDGGAGDRPMNITLDHVKFWYASLYTSSNHGLETGLVPTPSTVSVTNSDFRFGSNMQIANVGPVTVTGNSVTTTAAPYPSCGISVGQAGHLQAVSPTIVSNNTVTGTRGGCSPSPFPCCGSYPAGGGVVVAAPSGTNDLEPVVQNNSVANTDTAAVSVFASRLVASKLTGNTASADTIQIFKLGGTLVSNLTLPMPNSAPVAISDGSLTIAFGATLTVQAGTIVKITNLSGA